MVQMCVPEQSQYEIVRCVVDLTVAAAQLEGRSDYL